MRASYLPAFFFFLGADFLALVAVAGFDAVLVPDFLPKTLSQFFENSGLGPERTIGPDIMQATPSFNDGQTRLETALF